ncbi:MAG: hypothetical protein QUV04_02815 [Synechococcus sp. WH 8007]|nr:hypothetical protein [Synechococcus sp. WH 8007]
MEIYRRLEKLYLFHRQGEFRCLFVPGAEFSLIADDIDKARLKAFCSVAPEANLNSDLDGRDPSYWHILILSPDNRLLGGQRLRFSLNSGHWSSATSYLEYSYPGITSVLNEDQRPFVEVGRVFVTSYARGDHRILPLLLKLSSLVAQHYGYKSILGLMSYTYISSKNIPAILFLDILQQGIDASDLALMIPAPRHPSILKRLPSNLRPSKIPFVDLRACSLHQVVSLVNAEMGNAKYLSTEKSPFRIPPFLSVHSRLSHAVPIGLSEALGYNLIHEILMETDLCNDSKGATHPCTQSPLTDLPASLC